MRSENMKSTLRKTYLVLALMVAVALMVAPSANAATPGITGTGTVGTFNLSAAAGYTTQPDGRSIYTWGYGCAKGSTPSFVPAGMLMIEFRGCE